MTSVCGVCVRRRGRRAQVTSGVSRKGRVEEENDYLKDARGAMPCWCVPWMSHSLRGDIKTPPAEGSKVVTPGARLSSYRYRYGDWK